MAETKSHNLKICAWTAQSQHVFFLAFGCTMVWFFLLLLLSCSTADSRMQTFSFLPSSAASVFRWIDAYITLTFREAHLTEAVDFWFGSHFRQSTQVMSCTVVSLFGAVVFNKHPPWQRHVVAKRHRHKLMDSLPPLPNFRK